MKKFNFKNSILAVAAIAMSLTASARTNANNAGSNCNNLSTASEVNEDGTEITSNDSEGTEPIVIAKDYVADGTGFILRHDIDWDKQYVKAIIDLSTCQRSTEDIFSLGSTATDWYNNIHVYRKWGKLTSVWDGNDGNGDNNTGEYDVQDVVTIVVNKAEGLVVDGTVRIAADRMSGLYDLTEIAIGSGEGSDQQSYASYNSIEILAVEVPSGIEILDNNNTKAGFNVYNMKGQIVKSGTTDLNTLPHGIYIVNGKKVLK